MREKIALAVFALLVVGAVAVLTAYFSTGRTWNVAASFVDDTMGRMEGYTVLAYAGTLPATDEDDDAEIAAAENRSALTADNEDFKSTTIGMVTLPFFYAFLGPEEHRLYVSDVRSLYEQKGASVITLDTADPKRYEEPTVLYGKNRVIGVCSVDSYTTRAALQAIRTHLLAQGADTIVCIAPRAALLATFELTDIVVLTADAEASPEGRDEQDCFVIEAPAQGEVGVTILTSTGVPSGRVFTVL